MTATEGSSPGENPMTAGKYLTFVLDKEDYAVSVLKVR